MQMSSSAELLGVEAMGEEIIGVKPGDQMNSDGHIFLNLASQREKRFANRIITTRMNDAAQAS
jgi:hypothetical protein